MNDLDNLVEALHLQNLKFEQLSSTSGGIIVILEHGARVIGVFPSSHSQNFVWVNPDLIKRLPTSWNTGGDRIWLSPDIQFNVPEITQENSYEVQRNIDPGHYQFEKSPKQEIHLKQISQAKAFRLAYQLNFDIEKKLRLVSNPLTLITEIQHDYSFIGYEQSTELSLIDTGIELSNPLHVSLWSILQVPFDGQAFIGTHGPAKYSDFVVDEYHAGVTIQPHGIHMDFSGHQRRKISVKVAYASGRIGYYRQNSEDDCTLIVRQFSYQPSANYPDVSVSNLNDSGHVVQCYKDDGYLGYFGELEYHSPSIQLTHTQHTIQDTSQVWCYSGNKKRINEISEILLGTTFR